MRIIVFGASGTAGSEVVRQAVCDSEIDHVSVVVRKPLDYNHPKILMITPYDFLNYNELLHIFRETDACIWCLGISQTKVSNEEYIKTTSSVQLAKAM